MIAFFEQIFSASNLRMDATQVDAVKYFYLLHERIHKHYFFSQPEKMGLYLWGGVGRGKTIMMDAFFQLVAKPKVRLHYHELLQQLLNQLKQHENKDNPMQSVIDEMAQSAQVIFFDDLHLHDIADGTLWQGVFNNALKNNIFLVITSNYHPDTLLNIPGYQFKIRPVLESMKQKMDIFQLDHGEDYRYRQLNSDNEACRNLTEQSLATLFQQLKLPNKTVKLNGQLTIQKRPIHYLKQWDKGVWFDFEAICGTNRSYRDYLDLCLDYDCFYISNISAEIVEERMWIQRFVWLIDVLYDKNKTLYIASDEPLLELLDQVPKSLDLPRTKSRLTQMLFIK